MCNCTWHKHPDQETPRLKGEGWKHNAQSGSGLGTVGDHISRVRTQGQELRGTGDAWTSRLSDLLGNYDRRNQRS